MPKCSTSVFLAAAVVSAPVVLAQQPAGTGVQPAAGINWTKAPFPGVASATVEGDMAKGASYFYLRYDPGLVTPLHSHTADHRGTMVTGSMVLVVDGKESRLTPGSFFALKNKAKHVARCEGVDPCVMFIHAEGPWDVVPAN
jgi:quercetin dioxygenase-like cupin family protein